MKNWICFLLLVATGLSAFTQSHFVSRESAIQAFQSAKSMDEQVYACFYVADDYMEVDQYDSAQLWLNRIYDVYKIRSASKFNYFLSSRQAEVYYYNGLLELGLETAQQSLQLAQELNDSLLLADANNFVGLFYTTMDSSQRAIPFFETGMRYVGRPPYPQSYLSITLPHHLYGNLAEAFYKLQRYDSALIYSQRSLRLARDVLSKRGEAVAHQLNGNCFLQLNQVDSAQASFESALLIARVSRDIDVALLGFSGQALVAMKRDQRGEAWHMLDSGFNYLRSFPSINILFTRQFLSDALTVYHHYQDVRAMVGAYRHLVQLDSTTRRYNNQQVQSIIRYAGKADQQLLQWELSEAKRSADLANTRFWLLIAAVSLLLLIGAVVYSGFRQKLRVINLRQSISRDLHDEVGGTLSGIGFMSDLTVQKLGQGDVEGAKGHLHKIQEHARDTTEKMSDIIWMVNPENDRMEKVIEKLSHYTRQLTGSRNMHLNWEVEAGVTDLALDTARRRQLYLIVKEAVHNAVKHSDAEQLSVRFYREGKRVWVDVKDNGKGFDPSTAGSGNGLRNMQARARDVQGSLEIREDGSRGVLVRVSI
jgi:signal transduction histidine kinase